MFGRRFTLPPAARLRKGREYDCVFRTGFRVQGELVRLLCLKIEGPTQLGFAVGRRQGAAHVRNRGKRILREAFRRLRPWLIPGFHIVATLRAPGLAAKADSVYFDVAGVLERRGFLDAGWPGAIWD